MKYLITSFTGLGNMINKTPMFMKIHRIDHAAEIYIIGDNRWGALDLVENSPFNIDIYNIKNKDRRSVKRWINLMEFDVTLFAVDGGVPYWLNKMIKASNCKKIFTHLRVRDINQPSLKSWYKNYFNNKNNLFFVPKLQGRHEIDVNYDLLESFYNKPIEREYTTWAPKYNDNVKSTLNRFNVYPKKYICFQVCAANGNATPKIWDYKNFIELFNQINIQAPGISLIIIGDRNDYNKYIKNIDWPNNVINTANKTSLEEMIILVDNARCVVAHDSGVMHIANGLGVNLIALYGPTDFTWTKPMGKKSKVLFSKNEAYACMYNEKLSESEAQKQFNNFSAMSGITTEDVLRSLKPFLE